MSPLPRLPALDAIKAVAIVAVLVTHAVPSLFDRRPTPGELTTLLLSGFSVPAFLFVSGFLSRADAPVDWRRVAGRLLRLLPPYLVATAIVSIVGLATFPTPRKLVFTLVTGAAFGHFYFVPVLALCFLLLPVISRLGDRALIAVAAVLGIGAEAMWLDPRWRLGEMLFWQVRNPVLQFHLGYFVLGALACRYRAPLARIGARRAPLVVATAAAITGFAYATAAYPDAVVHPLVRATYTLAVMVFIASLTPSGPVPTAVRFASDATLTTYLYHWFAYLAAMPYLTALTLGVRIPLLVTVGLAFGTIVALVGRRIFGRASRVLLGT